jgi:hypothetical protein
MQQQQMQMPTSPASGAALRENKVRAKTFEPVSLDSLKVGDQIVIGATNGLKVGEVCDIQKMFFPGRKMGDTYIEEHFETKVEAKSLTPSRQTYTYFEQTIMKKDSK